MAKYQKYAEYKDSGVEWLGEIPSHWVIAGFKKYLESIVDYRGKTPEKVEDGVFLVTARNIKNGIINYSLSKEYVALKDYDEIMSRGQPLLGDVLFTTEAPLGEVAQVDKKYIALAQRIVKFRGKENILDNTYLKYFILSKHFQDSLMIFATGSTALGIKAERLGYLQQCIPPIYEQELICNFLDHETAKIDTLIAKQKKLIELLKEKRQAVISHAVTKGLNPNVKMKDSGVEWLGRVPEHWEVRQLRYLGSCQNGINIGAEYFGSGSSFISYGDVYRNPELPSFFDGLVQSTENDKRIYSVQRGDVLFTRTSETIEEIGFSSACLSDVKDATFAGFLIRFRPIKNTLLPEYSKFYFRNILLRAFFVKEMNLVTRASLSQELLKKLAVPFLSLEEQKQIAHYLSAKERVFDKLVNDCIKQIELLKVRRTALISAAVTGKIDVRHWENPNKNNNQENMECST